MKKRIMVGVFSVFFGFIIGKIWFTKMSFPKVSKDGERYYFLQEGIYYSDASFSSKHGIVEKNNDKYVVYSGITRNLEVAEKIMNFYQKKDIQLSIKEKYLKSEEFKNNVEQFDLLIQSSSDGEEIMKIEEVVLANYEEIIKSKYS